MEDKIYANIIFCEKTDREYNAIHVFNKVVIGKEKKDDNADFYAIISLHGYSEKLDELSFRMFVKPVYKEKTEEKSYDFFINSININTRGHFKAIINYGIDISIYKELLKSGDYELVIMKCNREDNPSATGPIIGRNEFTLVLEQ